MKEWRGVWHTVYSVLYNLLQVLWCDECEGQRVRFSLSSALSKHCGRPEERMRESRFRISDKSDEVAWCMTWPSECFFPTASAPRRARERPVTVHAWHRAVLSAIAVTYFPFQCGAGFWAWPAPFSCLSYRVLFSSAMCFLVYLISHVRFVLIWPWHVTALSSYCFTLVLTVLFSSHWFVYLSLSLFHPWCAFLSLVSSS